MLQLASCCAFHLSTNHLSPFKLIILIGLNLSIFSIFDKTTQIFEQNRCKGDHPAKVVTFASIFSISAKNENSQTCNIDFFNLLRYPYSSSR